MRPTREGIPWHVAVALDELGAVLGGKVVCLVLVSEDELKFCFSGTATQDAIRRVEEAMFDLLTTELLDEA